MIAEQLLNWKRIDLACVLEIRGKYEKSIGARLMFLTLLDSEDQQINSTKQTPKFNDYELEKSKLSLAMMNADSCIWNDNNNDKVIESASVIAMYRFQSQQCSRDEANTKKRVD